MASTFSFKSANETKYDIVSLGEVMMRIDPGDVPTARARLARIWHGGGETNVAEGLAYVFKMRGAVVTALVDDGIGHNIEAQLNEAGVDTSNIIWFNTKGKGDFATDAKGSLHNGINFTWKGKGVLPSMTEYYRAHSAATALKPGDFDWDALFSQGVRWFHTGGIFTLIGPQTAGFALEAMKSAGKHGTFRSFDLNYRSKVEPNKEKAREINRKIVSETEFLVGNQGDFSDALGYDTRKVGKDEPMEVFMAAYTDTLRAVSKDFPNLKIIGTQLRSALSADLINWGAVLYDVAEDTIYQAVVRERVEIADRTGGGDSFCNGVAASLMMGKTTEEAVDYGAAHGAIVQEFPGDTTMATLAMIEKEINRAKTGGGVSAMR
ncbi:MAG: sugar kinase [Candidatus Latescibacteria bacterium]|jgi:2-dehydro-3-deoxygluconokinase|nr:sugar kinase [Candidatus Latescibacterota bacterium]